MNCDNCEVKYHDYYSPNISTWCTNCGNYAIDAALKRALVAEQIPPYEVLLAYDVGCHGNGADKIGGYRFHGLHGRVIPFSAGAAIANSKVKVIAQGGDGGTLSEGLSHLVHAIRNNYNFTFILHNNSNYGLTTGQASSTTKQGAHMNASPDGPVGDTMNVLSFVLSLEPSFVARTFSANVKHTTEILQKAIKHKGFSFVEILQDCPTYNQETPHEWYMERVWDVATDASYDATDIKKAREIVEDLETKIATGVIYHNPAKTDFLARQKNRENIQTELVDEVKFQDVSKLLARFK